MYSKLFISLILSFLSLSITAQLPIFDWAKSFENLTSYGNGGYGRTIGVDQLGNVYTAGNFIYTMDFDPGPAVYSLTGGSPSGHGIYISKLDADGNFVWAKQISALLEFSQLEIKVDKLGNVYLATDSRTACDLDPGSGTQLMTLTGFRDVIIVKLNSEGNFVWGKHFGGPGDTGPKATMIELDSDNNIIITGIFNNTVDFDPGPNFYNLTSSAHTQSFILKLNNNGDFLWAKQFGNGPEVYSGSSINDIKCDRESNMIVTGQFQRTCDFDPGPGVFIVTSSSGSAGDGYISKLDKNGNFIWVRTFGQVGGNNSFVSPTGIEIDGENNIVTTGYFIGNFDFDPGPSVNQFSSINYDCYILKLNENGNLIWVKRIGDSEIDTGNDVVIDQAGDVYVVGTFGPSVDFDPGPGVNIITSPNYGASVLIKLSANGDYKYAAPFKDVLSYASPSLFRRMVVDSYKNIYITGVTGNVDFDPGPATFSTGYGPFVLKLNPCLTPSSSTLYVTACDSYNLNNENYSTSGIYVQSIPNASGCDSSITLHLTITKTFTEQTRVICNGASFFAGGALQSATGIYFDSLRTVSGCDSIVKTTLTVNPNPIPNLGMDKNICRSTTMLLSPGNFSTYLWQDNSNDPTFVVTTPGTYWVRVTNNFNCVATDTFTVLKELEPPVDFLKKSDSICNQKGMIIESLGIYTNYEWSSGQQTNKIQITNPGIYSLKVTNANGCSAMDSIVIFPKKCMFGIYIPSAFTPNNDGRNDLFKPIVFDKTIFYHMIVYNRWGSIVFETVDASKGWNGTLSNLPQDNGAYVWICTYQLEGQSRKTEKGTVMLIR